MVFLSSGAPQEKKSKRGRKEPSNQSPTCSMTSGAIQHGVPTNVFRTLFLVMSPPVAKKALTPKSRVEMFKKAHIKKSDKCFKHNTCEVEKKNKKTAKTQNNYQQFARSRHRQEEYFQLLDPWVRSEKVINAHTLLADKQLHPRATWFLFALCVQPMVKKKKVGRVNDTICTTILY